MEELDHEAGQAVQEPPEQEEKKTQSQILVGLCSDMQFVHDEQGEGYAKVNNNGHYELWPIKSKKMKLILTDRYMKAYSDKVPSDNAKNEAVSALEAKAVLRGKRVKIHTRIAETEEAIYVDLCNDKWEAIEIKKDGWKIVSEPPVYFKRSDIMQPLPRPSENGKLNDLKPFINFQNENDYKLIIAWILSTMKENNPFPILTIQGEQGSAKSTTTKVLRALVDPSSLPLRALPNDEQTLAISANNTWILAYDNLSGLSTGMSDSLCKMSTGGGLSVRELYTTGEEAVFNIMRPSILNGIDDIAQRPDLLDRSIVITLPSISEEARTDEKTFWKNFREKQSSILGAICDVVTAGLRELSNTTLEKRPRMADFALWITACEKSLSWSDGEFMDIYNENRGKAIDQGIESDPFASAIVEIMKRKSEWIGNASQLLGEAAKYTDERTARSRAWPTSRSVRNRLRRINPSLEKIGIGCDPWFNQMRRTLKIERLSHYRNYRNDRNEASQDKGLTYYDNNYDKTINDDTSSYDYDNEKTSSLKKAYHDKAYDDNDDNDDISEETSKEGEDILI